MLPLWMRPRAFRETSPRGRKADRQVSTPKQSRPSLRVEELETRLVPSTTSVLGGLNIATGAAYSNAPLSGSFNVAGQSFSGQSLQVSYLPATAANHNVETISISGGASATIAGHAVDLVFGSAGNAGIVLTNGRLSHFDGMMTTPSFSVGSLSLGSAHLEVGYLAAGAHNPEELSITGSASATFGSTGAQNVAVTLGDAVHQTPGIVIQRGVLQSADMTVSGQFTLGGLTFKAQSIDAVYQASNDTIGISGGASITLGGSSVHVQVGTDAAHPGIVISHGSLRGLDAAVTGNLNLYGVSVQANQLAVQYANNHLSITGGVGFSLADKFAASVAIDHGGLTVDTRTGAVSFDTNDLGMSGSLTLGGAEVAASFMLHHGVLDDLSVSYDAKETRGIAMGDTGLFLMAVSGSVHHLTHPEVLDVHLGVTVAEGSRVQLMGHDYSLLEATGTIAVTPHDMILTGDVSIGGDFLGHGTAKLDLNWQKGVYTAAVNVGMYDDAIQYGGSITLTKSGDVTIDATAGVFLPAATPPPIKEAIEAFTNGQDSLGQLGVHLEIHPGDASASFGAASILVAGAPVIGFQVNGNGQFTLTGGGAAVVANALHQIGQTAQVAGRVLQDAYGQTAQQATQLFQQAGYSATEIASALQGAYNQTAQQAAQALKQVGYYGQVTAYALQNAYHLTAQQAAQALHDAGYEINQVAGALNYAYNQTALQAAQILSYVTDTMSIFGNTYAFTAYGTNQVAATLRDMYWQNGPQVGRILYQLGYDAATIATDMKGVFQMSASDVESFLHNNLGMSKSTIDSALHSAGYAANEIKNALNSFGNEVAHFFGF